MAKMHKELTVSINFSRLDPNNTGDFKHKDHAKAELEANITELSLLQEMLYANQKQSILIILQGMDTSGKDSLIKHAFKGINPQGCSVHSFKRPTDFELAHDYMWRYTKFLPALGMISIFNRSYYEESTVVRIHPEFLALRSLEEKAELWQRRHREFNQLEHYLIHNNIIVIKIFLHISKDEQLKRLKRRLNNPEKHWKFDISDIREREHWDRYMAVYQESLSATNSDYAPWHIIPANKHWYAQLKFSELLVQNLRALKLQFPELKGEKKLQIEKARAELA